ncbi:sigma factor [Microbispora rosea]|uniref:sigma factor n=1 Tax=Microbispora rosea TaxID=58117 RepID=UPI00313C263E
MAERGERRTDPAEPLDRAGPANGVAVVDSATAAFVAHRNLLFTVAYEMLGSAVDAEDVLQETWLWAGVDLDTVREESAPFWCGSSPGRRLTGCVRSTGARRPMSGRGCPSRC